MSVHDFAAAFSGRRITYIVVDEVTHFDARLDKIRALINHPDTPEHEREAGLRALERIGLVEGE